MVKLQSIRKLILEKVKGGRDGGKCSFPVDRAQNSKFKMYSLSLTKVPVLKRVTINEI